MAEREALAAVIPTDPGFVVHQVEARVRKLEYELAALDRADGTGALQATPVGDAAVAWTKAVNEWRWCEKRAPGVGLRERHQLHKRADRAAERIGPLRDAFETLAGPERARLRAQLPEAKKTLDEMRGQFAGHVHFTVAHPEALRRLERLDSQIADAAWELDVERQDLDGIASQRPQPNTPEHDIDPVERGLDRGIERGIDLGIGL